MALFVANLRLILRDRQTLFWALAFPLVFVVVFGLLDIGSGPTNVTGAIIDQANTSLSHSITEQVSHLSFVDLKPGLNTLDAAQAALQNGNIDFVVVLPPQLADVGASQDAVPLRVLYEPANAISNQAIIGALAQVVDQINLNFTGQPRVLALQTEAISGQQASYFDVVLVGLVGMALMFNSIITIAVKLSMYRDQKVFKRLLATPLPVSRFFSSFILAHMLLALVQVGVILAVGVFVFGGTIHGNVGWLFLMAAIGNIIFLNIGFIVGGFAKTPAAASGLGNIVVLPMLFFTGIFFSVNSLPSFLPKLVQVLPLTPLVNVLQTVAIDGRTPLADAGALALLGGWVVVSSFLAVRLFRFRD